MLHGQLRAHLHRRCEGRTTEPMLDRMLRWLNATVFPWLRVVLQPSAACAAPVAALEQWQARLRFFFLQLLASLRIGELFELIRDYPETLPAIEDLRECLRHTQQHEVLVARLRTALESRLLKPGVEKRDASAYAQYGTQQHRPDKGAGAFETVDWEFGAERDRLLREALQKSRQMRHRSRSKWRRMLSESVTAGQGWIVFLVVGFLTGVLAFTPGLGGALGATVMAVLALATTS